MHPSSPSRAFAPRRSSRRLLAVITLLAASLSVGTLAGCGKSAPPPANAEVAAPTDVSWLRSDQEARSRAAAAHRPRFVDVRADWCPTCRNVEATTLRDPRVRTALARFVATSLDVTGTDDAAMEAADTYGVRGLPAMRVFDADGRLVAALDGNVDAETLLAALAKVP
ncbi:MAG: thioredoxin family protein [Myxococcales bacterium]|nr:thioredoxin family protein [Myxococcales bacterium]